jgi:hypothetical protein
MSTSTKRPWPIQVQDRADRNIYLTEERWQHALEHPQMRDDLLDAVLATVRVGHRRGDALDPSIVKYSRRVTSLPYDYTHMVVVVKFGLTNTEPPKENNFVLTAYLVRRGESL